MAWHLPINIITRLNFCNRCIYDTHTEHTIPKITISINWHYNSTVTTSFLKPLILKKNCHISFVGNDYYCESGHSVGEYGSILYVNDPLWDGQECPGLEATCCMSSKMPWFVKTLNETVSEDIELITCGWNHNYLTYGESIPLDFTLNNNLHIHLILKLPHTFTHLENNYNHLNSNTVFSWIDWNKNSSHYSWVGRDFSRCITSLEHFVSFYKLSSFETNQ